MEETKNNAPGVNCSKRKTFAYILIILGVLALFKNVFNVSILSWFCWSYVWPILIILLGIHLISKRK